ncbi:hypothetical protein BKE38_27935 [Pseudoroseomonas deserti]|uniref:Calcium-binding protein n=1 Tax=Teichococcus deserti TaxID=1817963 RepID=A0A1V2GUP3_9PROT|nr:calcium-binding protein [Pseudoroseomonas deserti]ONG44612.1 hypothetical protein BKE38_27935 [Pseudoroseomonas deserti]
MATIIGTGVGNTLTGTALDDTIQGLGGNDTIDGGLGADILSGGSGDDVLVGGRGADTLHGGTGNDTFRYRALAEMHLDRIMDFALGDRVDVSALGLSFIGERAFTGAGMELRLAYLDGNTLLQVDVSGLGDVERQLTMAGIQRLTETANGSGILIAATPLTLVGTAAADTLTGGAGDDRLSGMAGADTLDGGAGNDVLKGGDGNDLLVGGAGGDTLLGGPGNDLYRYRANTEFDGDRLIDFSEGDRIDFSGLTSLTWIADEAFSRTPGEVRLAGKWLQLDLDGNGVADAQAWISGGGMLAETSPGSRVLQRANAVVLTGADTAETLSGGGGADRIDGAGGNDLVNGLAGDDMLHGGAGNDALNGGSGHDWLEGGLGDDTLTGGSGNDRLIGGSGNDVLVGGLGADILRGGTGKDIFRYASAAELDGDIIRDLEAGDLLSLSGMGRYSFIGNDSFTGAGMEIRFDGGLMTVDIDGDGLAEATAAIDTGGRLLEGQVAGSLTLIVAPDRVLNGTAAANILAGAAGQDTLSGLDGDDTLNGGAGNDMLRGGNGNDTLRGGSGSDMLEGGLGYDIFVIEPDRSLFNTDTIADFNSADTLDLTAFWNLAWLGDTLFSGARPEARQLRTSLGLRIEIDADGDGLAEQAVFLAGAGALREAAAGSRLLTLATPRNLTGDAGANVLVGDAADDVLIGLEGNDTLVGWGGNDRLEGGPGGDTLRGETGDDILIGGADNDTLIAGLGRDLLTGGSGADIVRYRSIAEIGLLEDRITDLAPEDRIDLSPIDDLRFTDGGFTGVAGQVIVLDSWQGRDLGWTFLAIDADGDGQADAVLSLDGDFALEEATAGTEVLRRVADLVLDGGAGNDGLTGRAGRDTLSGLDGNDMLNGNAGDDLLRGGEGNDTLLGGLGNDVLQGDDGNDTLQGGEGSDTLRGGAGNDTLIGGLGADLLSGGAGNDIVRYLSAAELAGDTIADFAAGDLLDVAALGARFLGDGAFAADGTAQLRIWQLGVTWLAVDSDGDGRADATLSLGTIVPLEETFTGSGLYRRVADLVLAGTAGADTLQGKAGNDILGGAGGDDILLGAGGNDILDGGAGSDTLNGGPGSDTMTGGLGNDSFLWTRDELQGAFTDTITDMGVGDSIDLSALGGRFIGANAFSAAGEAEVRQNGASLLIDWNGDGFTDGAIQMTGLAGLLEETAPGLFQLPAALNLVGTAGADVLTGRGNADTISGLAGPDILAGGGGDDLLLGGAGNDTLLGGEGHDRLVGGPGTDTMTGGSGNDRFIFSDGDVGLGSVRDVIADFNAAAYADQLDLSGIDADLTTPGDQAFILSPTGSITGPGQLVFGNGILYGNVDADLAPDFEIALNGVTSLASYNFWAL